MGHIHMNLDIHLHSMQLSTAGDDDDVAAYAPCLTCAALVAMRTLPGGARALIPAP